MKKGDEKNLIFDIYNCIKNAQIKISLTKKTDENNWHEKILKRYKDLAFAPLNFPPYLPLTFVAQRHLFLGGSPATTPQRGSGPCAAPLHMSPLTDVTRHWLPKDRHVQVSVVWLLSR